MFHVKHIVIELQVSVPRGTLKKELRFYGTMN
ncbi:hypothetical protein L1276_001530 [Flavobacterium sp. HSC-32F16]|nr:hypothetical protein [Flavobacterium sp. HSC-32F16]